MISAQQAAQNLPAEEREELEQREVTWADVYGPYDRAVVPMNEEQAMRLSAVYACARVFTEAISILPVSVLERDGEEQVRNRTHPVFRLFNGDMNPDMTSSVGVEFMLLSMMLAGNALAEIDFDGAGRPSALWPFAPHRVSNILKDDFGNVWYQVYGDPRNDTGGLVEEDLTTVRLVAASAVFHVPFLGNGRWGLSPVGHVRTTFDVARSGEAFNKQFFDEGAYLRGTLTTEARMSKDARQQLGESWRQQYAGAKGYQRTAVLTHGIKFNQIQVPPQDALFLESRKYQKREIAAIFRVPLHMINDLEMGASYASIDSIRQEFYKLNVASPIKKIQQEIRRKLISDPRFSAEFNRDSVLQGNTTERFTAYGSALGGGANPGFMTVNEIRRLENRPRVDGGDELFVPMNTQPINEEGDGSGEEGEGASDRSAQLKEVEESLVGILRQAATKFCGVEAERAKRHAKKDRQGFVDWAERFFRKEADLVVEELRSTVDAIGRIHGMAPSESIGILAQYGGHHAEARLSSAVRAYDNGDIDELAEVWKVRGGDQIAEAVLELMGVSNGA